MKNKDKLIINIKKCNLSKENKAQLIDELKEDKPDYVKFLNTCFNVFKVGKDCLKLFDIDIGDFPE